MLKKVLIFFIIIAVICSGISLFTRHRVEKKNRNVELIIDNKALSDLEEKTEGKGISYAHLKKMGVTGIAASEKTIARLVNEADIKLIHGNELMRREIISGVRPAYSRFNYDRDSGFLVFSGKKMIKRAQKYFSVWQEQSEIKAKSHTYMVDNSSQSAQNQNQGKKQKRFLVFFPEWKSNYLNLSLGFDDELISSIREAGLKVIPRLENKEGKIKNSLETDLQLLKKLSPDFMIFAGDEVVGYPDQMEKTAGVMKENKIDLGMIEAFIGYQKGVDSLARLLNFNLMRVHSIQQGEMEKYSQQEIIDRYLRAVRERNVRLLYLKPFLNSKNETKPIKLNNEYLNRLTARLDNLGYEFGNARPFEQFHNSIWMVLLIGLGIFSAGIILLEKLFDFNLGITRIILLFLGLGAAFGLLQLEQNIFLRKLLALGSSVIFPSLAVIVGVFEKNKSWFKSFLWTVAISFIGVLLLAGSLSHTSFMLKIDQFRGVKLAFLLPLFIIAFYYWRRFMVGPGNNYSEYIKNLLDKNIKIKHLLVALVLGVVGIIYLARSGNYSFLPVLEVETMVRELLEDLLYVRPRFKAFLIGHPLLVLSLYYRDQISSHLIGFPLVVLAGIGQITVANTFAHVHIPLIISILRSLHGYWLGLLVGLLVIGAVKIINRLRVSLL